MPAAACDSMGQGSQHIFNARELDSDIPPSGFIYMLVFVAERAFHWYKLILLNKIRFLSI